MLYSLENETFFDIFKTAWNMKLSQSSQKSYRIKK